MNLKQLAEHLRLSSATVSRVLAGKAEAYRIGEDTQQRVRAAAQKLGVSANQQARGLRLRTTHTIGLIVPDISNPFFAGFCRQVEQVARARGYWVLVADSQEQIRVERDLLTLVRSRGVDGLIIAPVSGNGEHLSRLVRDFKPLVLVDRVAPSLRTAAVILDNEGAARAGVDLLASSGHTRIACLHGLASSIADQQRLRGYHGEMKRLGLRVPAGWVAGGDYTIESGRIGTERVLAHCEPPTAILALGNLLALGALESLRAASLRIPEDVSIISFDEQPWAASLAPPLTTISQPVQEMGSRATELLFKRLDGISLPDTSTRAVMPFRLIERSSHGPAKRAK